MLYQSAKDMKCLACGKYGHFVIDCPFIHLTNYKSLVIGKHNYSQEQIRSQLLQRRTRKNPSLTSILHVRHALKKIRIKYIQKSEKDKERRILLNDELLSAQKTESKMKSQEDKQNKTCDTSDLSDFKYELEIEQQQRKLKLEGEKGRLLAASDMYFYHRHPCIQFLENQVYTFSMEEISCSFSQQSGHDAAGGNSMFEDEDNVIDQEVDYIDGDDETQFQAACSGSKQEQQLDLEIIAKGNNARNEVENVLVSNQMAEKDKEFANLPRKSCFNIFNHQNSIETASQNSGTCKSTHNKQGQHHYHDGENTFDNNSIIGNENHKQSPGFDFIPLDQHHTTNFPQSQEQCVSPMQNKVLMSQSNEGDFQNAVSTLKRSSLDSNYINIQKNFFKKEKFQKSSKQREPYPLKAATQRNPRNGNNTPTPQSLQQQQQLSSLSPPSSVLWIPESASYQHIAINRSKKKQLKRNNSFLSVGFSHQNLYEEGSTEKHSRNQNHHYPRSSHAAAEEAEQFLQLPTGNLAEVTKSRSKIIPNLHQDTAGQSHIKISRGSSLESLNMELSIDQEGNKVSPALVIGNEISRGKSRKQFITGISRNHKPNMEAIKQALLNRTNRDEEDNKSSDSQRERKQFSISCLPMDSSKTNKISSQGQDGSSSKDNQTATKMKMTNKLLWYAEKPLHTSSKRDLNNFNNANNMIQSFSNQDRALNPSIFIQQPNSNNAQKSIQALPISLSTSGQGKQHKNGQKSNGNSTNINSIHGLGNKPLRKQASIFLAPESNNRGPRKTINSSEQAVLGHQQQLQSIQNDTNLHQQTNQNNWQHLQQQQPQQESYKQQNPNQIPQEDIKQHPQQRQQKQGTKEEIDYVPQEEEFEIGHFEKPKCYSVYYPHNNLPNVLESLNKYQFKLLFISRLHLGIQKKSTTGQQQPNQQPNNAIPKQLNITSLLRRFMVKH